MPNPIVGLAGAGIVSGLLGARAAGKAADAQAGAARGATQAQLRMFNTVNSQQAPYRNAGKTALKDMVAGTAPGGYFSHQFNANDLNANLAPNYEFMRDQGLGAIRNQLSAQGGLLSGNTLKGINDYAMNYAGNAYQQAFQNYTANQTNIFNRLSNIAGLGQTANQATGNAAIQTGTNIGNNMIGAGQAQASGIVGANNALTGGLNSAMGWYALPDIMKMSAG